MAIINGNSANDTLAGTPGSDTINGGAGNDQIDGGAGTDAALYGGGTADYDISTVNGVTFIKDRFHRDTGWDGNDKLTGVERLVFADGVHFVVANKASTAVADTASATEDLAARATGSLLGNDSDLDGDALSLVSVSFGGGAPVTDGAPGVAGAYGRLTWAADGGYTYTLDTAAPKVQALADGQTASEVFAYNASDGWGGTATQSLTVTVVGTNDAPLVEAKAGDSAGTATPLLERNSGLTATGKLTVTDQDIADQVSVSVLSVRTVGDTGGLTPAQLLGFFSVRPTDPAALNLDADPGTTGNLAWTFDSSSEAFDFLDQDELLTLYYDIRPDDGHPQTGTGDGTVTIRIKGSDDPHAGAVTINGAAKDQVFASASPAPAGDYVLL